MVSLAADALPAQTPQPSAAKLDPLSKIQSNPSTTAARTDLARPFTPEEKMQLAAKVLAPSTELPRGARAVSKARPSRRKVLAVTVPPDTAALPKGKGRLAHVIVFDYTEGKASRLLVDEASAKVLATEIIRGRPQASEEEKRDAVTIIRGEPELARLLEVGTIVEGGFVVDGPHGMPPNHRFLQLQLLSADRLHVQRKVTINLTDGTIATSEAGR